MNRKKRYRRKNSLRLKGFDYSSEGLYFVTIVTKNRIPYFGNIQEGSVQLTAAGRIVKKEWLRTEVIRNNVILGEWIIMPNHLHGIIYLQPRASSQSVSKEEPDFTKYQNTFGPQRNNLSSIVRGFKAACTRRIRKAVRKNFSWHRSFHDHIIRNQKELARI